MDPRRHRPPTDSDDPQVSDDRLARRRDQSPVRRTHDDDGAWIHESKRTDRALEHDAPCDVRMEQMCGIAGAGPAQNDGCLVVIQKRALTAAVGFGEWEIA